MPSCRVVHRCAARRAQRAHLLQDVDALTARRTPHDLKGHRMTELARPTAKRLTRPSWRDSRLVIGVLLVLVAATLGAKAVASADDRVPVWAAADDLVVGDRVEASSLTRVDVLLADGSVPYLSADAPRRPAASSCGT